MVGPNSHPLRSCVDGGVGHGGVAGFRLRVTGIIKADVMVDDVGNARPRDRQRISLHGGEITDLPPGKDIRIDLCQRIERGEKPWTKPLWSYRTGRKWQTN